VRKIYTILPFLFLVITSQGQVFPVQLNTQLMPPYTPYLSDYTTSGAQKLILQLRVNDPTLTEYKCKLRITIEGVGITLKTKPNFIPQPITIEGGGIPQILYGEDMAEYFDPSNIEFAGLTQSSYSKKGKLPEGVYRFSVEVLDYNRNTVVSNKAMTIAWMVLNDPPLLNLPRNDFKATITDPLNIPFTWTPRHKGSPNAAFSTEYIFRLIELWPVNRNPYDAFLSQQPLYEIRTTNSQIVYGPAEPALIPGRKYAWQVQAIDVDGHDLFKNEGRSEVNVFQFGDPLGVPENLRLQSSNPSALTVRWDLPVAGSSPVDYRVRYRQHKNRDSEEWYENRTPEQWRAIPMLKSETEYEVQVRVEQQLQNSDYTPTEIFKTLPQGTNTFVCKDNVPLPSLPTGTGPLFKLGINDTIRAADYNVLVRRVTGGTGTYTGEGVAIVPWLNSAKVKVTFENIGVNEKFMLTSGVIKSVWDADSKFLKTVDPKINPGQNPKGGEIPLTIIATETLITIKDAAIASVTKDQDGNVTVYTTDGKTQVLQKGQSYSVVDSAGNGYVVDKDGNIVKTTAAQAIAANDRGKRSYNLTIKFEKGDGKFGFDEKKYDGIAHYYQQLENGNYIPWKAVTSSEVDALNVLIENTGIDSKKIKFEVNSSPLTPDQTGNNNITLKIRGKSQGMVEELLAVNSEGSNADAEILGKLNLVSYDQINQNVVIVPVNGAMLPKELTDRELSKQLTTIYNQSVTLWGASITSNLTVSLDAEFDDGESGLLSNYTSDMKKVINTYGRLQDNTYYLFLIAKPKSGISSLGYMPRSKQAGFIFLNNHNNDAQKLVRTMAHELGHGAFSLKHTFSEYPFLSQNSTENLMDYNYGTELLKYQWDYVHDPQRVIGLFEGDEEGECKSLLNSEYVFVHDDLSEKAYATNKEGANDAFTQEAVSEVDSILAELVKVNKNTYIYFGYVWIDDARLKLKEFDQWIDDAFNSAYGTVKKQVGISDFNLLTVVTAKFDRALREDQKKSASFREKFRPINGLDPACVKAINDYLISASRKKFVDGLDDALKERADKLKNSIRECKVEILPEIAIHYKRKVRNAYRTWGEFTILGTDYKGYILERPKGDNAPNLDNFRRYPAGTYNIGYSEDANGENTEFYDVTLYITKNSAYKLHGGNRADQSDGCLLINANSPEFDKYPEAYQYVDPDTKAKKSKPIKERGKVANSYFDHSDPNNPAYKLRKKVEEMEKQIKTTHKVETVIKKIIIDETEEKIEL
jgi:hypothetical protein